jgi:glycosyltransferase involved in cell wall biosynthesis
MKNQKEFIIESHVHTQEHLRVALVTETYPPEINGVAMTIGRMVNGLISRGHSVQVIRPKQTWNDHPQMSRQFEEVLSAGVAIPQYTGLKFGLPAKTKLMQLWKHRRPDIVHVVTEGPLGWSAVSAARKLKIPVTSSFHTNFHNYTKHYKLGFLKNTITGYLRKLHNNTMATLVPTKALAKELKRKKFKNLMVLSRGVDTALFNPSRRDPSLREKWGVSEQTLAVIYVGRLAAEKNIELVIKTFDAISEKVPNAKLIMVGHGPLHDEIEANNPHVFFAGVRSGEDLAAHYASADIFLFPSKTETFGNVTAEALASGLGVVAYDYAAAADIIQNNVNGITVKFDHESAFIHAAIDLANNRQKLAAIRKQAVESVAGLDWNSIHQDFETILRNVSAFSIPLKKDISVTTFIHDEAEF